MESQNKEENRFQFIDDALDRQVLLKHALEIDKALSTIVDQSKGNSRKEEFFWNKPREFYVEGVLSQVQAPLMYLLKDCVSGLDIRAKNKPVNVIEFYESANQIHLSLWRRKFIELLTDVKLFTTNKKDEYFLHYALIHEYVKASNINADLVKFYGANNRHWQHTMDLIQAKIIECENMIDVKDAWYLKSAKIWRDRKDKEKSGQNILQSFRQRYITAHRKFDNNELILTDLTYLGYSGYSQDIHAASYSFAQEETVPMNFDHSIDVISIFALTIYRNLARLLSLEDSIPWAKQIGERLDNKKAGDASAISNITIKPEIEIGDFILVSGALAEVTDIKLSEFNFRSFDVLFLSGLFIPGLENDSIPAFHAKPFLKKKDIKTSVLEEMNKTGFELIKELSEEQWDKYLRLAGIELHRDLLKTIAERFASSTPG